MNDSKMGFKHTMLQRLQNFDVSPGQTSPSQHSEESQQSSNCTNVTDFSINRILSDDKKVKHKKISNIGPSPAYLRPKTPASAKTTTAPSTPGTPISMDILDLSKSSSNSNLNSPCLSNPFLSYQTMQADFVAATKFYAQFFPHMFPAYNSSNSNLPLHNAGSLHNPNDSYHKYFHPYHTLPSTNPCLQVPIARLPSQRASVPKQQCSQRDCLECLDYYNKPLPLKPKPVTPLTYQQYTKASNLTNDHLHNSSSSIAVNSPSISLTSITNISLTPSSKTNKISSVISSLSSTIATNSEEISYKCRICDKVFGCLQTLQAHEKTHKSPRYECTDCGKGFSQLRNYKYHISVHRGTKEFAAECPECGKTFNDKGYLSSHMKIHRNKKEYECPYCPKSFNQRVAFNMHVRIHTGVKPHKCTECGKRFSRKMLLKQHMRTHSGEKPYQCSVCGKSFADRSNMTLHHRLHSGIKPFSCPICPKAFTKKHHLKTHLNYHTGCKPYVCPHPNCNQAFTQSSNMRTHAKKCQFRPLEYPALPESGQTSTTVATSINSTAMTPPITVATLSPSYTLPNNVLRSNELNSLNVSRFPLPTLPLSSQSFLPASSASNLANVSSTNSNVNAANAAATAARLLSSSASASASLLTSTAAMNGPSLVTTTLPQTFPFVQQPLISTLRPF